MIVRDLHTVRGFWDVLVNLLAGYTEDQSLLEKGPFLDITLCDTFDHQRQIYSIVHLEITGEVIIDVVRLDRNDSFILLDLIWFLLANRRIEVNPVPSGEFVFWVHAPERCLALWNNRWIDLRRAVTVRAVVNWDFRTFYISYDIDPNR